MTKINAANVEGGPAMAAKVVSDLLDGVGIDRYAVINVQGVQSLIDALGGIDLYVPKDMHYRDDSQHLYINLKKGQQHLNGDQALQYLRFRYDAYGDIGRIQRQQAFFRAMMEQCLNPGTITRLPEITKVIRSHVDTNLSMEELLALVGFASKMQRSNVDLLMLPGDFSRAGQYDASYWLPNYPAISRMVSEYLRPESGGISVTSTTQNPALNASRNLRITIENSSPKAGVVDAVATALERNGYRNLSVGDPYPQKLSVTRIIAQNGDRASAEAVRNALQVGEVRIENTGSLGSDITIQVGTDWQGR
jgi:LCP family protein required for cell wall assembly